VSVEIRPLVEGDLGEADRVFRLAFGTEFGLPEPMAFRGDAEMVRTRWRAERAGALGAFRGGQLLGTSFAARWGSFGVFGPLSVRPDCWSQGIGSRLLEPAMALFDAWKLRHSALFTFPQSLKHVGLYQKFGFWPQHLTAVMSKPVEARELQGALFSELDDTQRAACLAECAALAGSLLDGLDLGGELRSIHAQGLGDTVLLRDGASLEGFAACHVGKGSEAGSGSAYVKFGAVRPGEDAAGRFDRLISACEALAAHRGCSQLVAGTNTARHAAYRGMLERGFRSFLHGVAMQRPNDAGYNRPGCLVIDDWR
jgi:GNAT superfamily N-acetyltransferase